MPSCGNYAFWPGVFKQVQVDVFSSKRFAGYLVGSMLKETLLRKTFLLAVCGLSFFFKDQGSLRNKHCFKKAW